MMADTKDRNEPSHIGTPVRGKHSPQSDGKLEMVITYLEMRRCPNRLIRHLPRGLAVMHARSPTVSFYRYLYNTVGAPWLWHERRRLDDNTLRAIIHDARVEVYVLYVQGVPAGYIELDRRIADEVEVAYFGLIPEFIGRGLGRYLLDHGLHEAWREQPRRVWVHSCNHDHPKAIAVYQRAGFVPYKQETVRIDDPRLDGTI
ncbi:MAG: GNAT family N-acetyltransferase [Acidiferrobacterales bacterium]|nr:GNAT family N-acetyltransferase [Acidiferrobacterales bacterium]